MLLAVLSGFVLAMAAPWVHRASPRGAGVVLSLLPASLAMYFLVLLTDAIGGAPVRESRAWVPELGVELAFAADGLGALYALIISAVGMVVITYASAYLRGHALLGRFYAFILAFMASMLGVALADDLLLLFVFWELTSLTSFLLIGFQHEENASRASALQALLVTGAGGLCLLAGFVLLGITAGTFSISTLAAGGFDVREQALYEPILICVLCGAFTKSAQFPFHFWLPNAMAAPTPVSAYLHSATMVKAGVYLLARLHAVLGGTALWLGALSFAGGITMLLGAWLALQQTDLKRILAYSTVSVLGTLTLLLGVGSTAALQAAIVLLVAHAAYKGALFLVAGSIDHETGTRDVTRLSGLRRGMPITATVGVLAALSMVGLPPFVGFVSKELLYEARLDGSWFQPFVLAAVVLTNVLLGAVAPVAGIRPFFGDVHRGERPTHEPEPLLWVGPAFLALSGLAFGVLASALSNTVAAGVLAISSERVEVGLSLWHGLNLALALSGLTLLGAVLALWLRPRLIAASAPLRVLGNFGPDRLYGLCLEFFTVVARGQTRFLQNGYLRRYVALIITTVVALVAWAFFSADGFPAKLDVGEVAPYELSLAVVVLLAGVASNTAKSRLTAVVALGAVGYGVALLYVLMGAPDLAITQFAVETLSVILFLLVVYRLPPFINRTSAASRIRDALVAGAAGTLVCLLVLSVTTTPGDSRLSRWFAEHSLVLANGRNVVNVILVDFRALDTLGEITVLAVAAIGVFGLMKLKAKTT